MKTLSLIFNTYDTVKTISYVEELRKM